MLALRAECPCYDASGRPRRWRSLDLGATPVFVQATNRRAACPEQGCGPVADQQARSGAGQAVLPLLAVADSEYAGLVAKRAPGDLRVGLHLHEHTRLDLWPRPWPRTAAPLWPMCPLW